MLPQKVAAAVEAVEVCRGCGAGRLHSVIDLGLSPLANAYLSQAQSIESEKTYPLHAMLCESCLLMQLASSPPPEELFRDYRYFSSFSATMAAHASAYAQMATSRFALSPASLVVEIASNDGYLLRYFKERGIPVLGVDPAETVAEAARRDHGIPTLTRFFNQELAEELKSQNKRADLIIANNVLAHVPDIHDFLAGIELLLTPDGVVTFEFPDVDSLLAEGQFDTIYHEHCYYLSLQAVERLLAKHGMCVFDAEKLPVHGGSLRIYACREGSAHSTVNPRVEHLRNASLLKPETYTQLAKKAQTIKRDLLAFLADAKRQGKKVLGYGAPAKGTTLLNFCGIGRDSIAFTVDISPYKQGRFLPGSGIPILSPDALKQEKPDYVLILPWNLKEEIIRDHAYLRDHGGKFVLAIPELTVC